MKHDIRMVSDLTTVTLSRNQGHATELMNRVAEEADKKKVILILNPGAFDDSGPDTEQLIEWYASLGYQEIQQEPLLMARMFNIPQVNDAAERVNNIIMAGA